MEERVYDLEYEVSELEVEVSESEDLIYELEDIIERAKYQCVVWDDDAYMALSVLNEY